MHVFITGGTRGIGKGLVHSFLDEGWNVSYTGTSVSSIEQDVIHHNNVHGLVCDVRNKESIETALRSAVSAFGPIDVWINNAGVNQPDLSVDMLSDTSIKQVIDVNVTGMILCTSIALQHMKQQGHSRIYNMEGLGSNKMKIPNTIVYGSSKHLLTYFSKACNKELRAYPDIVVGTLQPGMVFTDLLLENMSEDGMKIARILGRKVEEVTPYLVKKIIKQKQFISYLTFPRMMASFITYPFTKRNQDIKR